MTEIKFKFSNDKQRTLNVGKSIDKEEHNKRKIGRHQRNMKLNLNMAQIRNLHLPEGIQLVAYAPKNAYGENITPNDPEYYTHKPITISLICSDIHPYPLARLNEYDLDHYITETFGKYIVTEKITAKEESGIEQVMFRHEAMLQGNEDTNQDKINNNSFNVYTHHMREPDLEYMNEKLRILGYKPFNKNNALMKTQKTINAPREYMFEVGEF